MVPELWLMEFVVVTYQNIMNSVGTYEKSDDVN